MGILIRIIEMYVISAVPSVICVWMALNKLTSLMAWRYMCTVSFLLCLVAHIWCWRREVIFSQNDTKGFYIVNLSAFAVYTAMIPILSSFADNEVFSAVYAALRGFEIFKLPTVLSIIISLVIMLVSMILTKRIVGNIVVREIAMAKKENEAEY